MAAKNCFWSRVHKYAFFSKRFFVLTLSQYVLRNFSRKTFSFKSKMVACGFFVILKSSYFQKIVYNPGQIQKQKILWVYKGYILKKIINWSVSRKIQHGAENQDDYEFRIFVKILLPQHA
jgi:hypothetical protein